MTDKPRSHRAVIEAALYDWWLTTDPHQPFHAPAVAEQVEVYLLSSGYVIGPDIPGNTPVPTRSDITTAVVLAVICTATAILAAVIHDWWWGTLGLLGAGLLVREAHRDIRDRRHARNHR